MKPKKKPTSSGRKTVRVEDKHGLILDEQHTLTSLDCDNPAYAGFKVGGTINMGNYESIRYEVSISAPCLPEQVLETFNRIKHLCEVQASKISSEYRGGE